jgi:hypothetical protein
MIKKDLSEENKNLNYRLDMLSLDVSIKLTKKDESSINNERKYNNLTKDIEKEVGKVSELISSLDIKVPFEFVRNKE